MKSSNNRGDTLLFSHLLSPNRASSTKTGLPPIVLLTKEVPWKYLNHLGYSRENRLLFRNSKHGPLAEDHTHTTHWMYRTRTLSYMFYCVYYRKISKEKFRLPKEKCKHKARHNIFAVKFVLLPTKYARAMFVDVNNSDWLDLRHIPQDKNNTTTEEPWGKTTTGLKKGNNKMTPNDIEQHWQIGDLFSHHQKTFIL